MGFGLRGTRLGFEGEALWPLVDAAAGGSADDEGEGSSGVGSFDGEPVAVAEESLGASFPVALPVLGSGRSAQLLYASWTRLKSRTR